MTRSAAALLALFLVAPLAGAQEPGTPPAPAGPDLEDYQTARKAVRKSLANLAESAGYRFTAKVTFPDKEKETGGGGGAGPGAMVIGLAGVGGGPKAGASVTGSVFADGLVLFTLDGTDRGATRQGGGMLFLRDGQGRWRPRLGRNLAGRQLWWRPDPTFLLAEATRLLGPEGGGEGIELARGGLKRVGLRHLREFRLTLGEEAALDLLKAGLLPNPTWAPRGGPGGMIITSFGSSTPPKDLKYEFSIWVDARTRTIHKIQILSTGKPASNIAGGRVVFRMGQGGKMIAGNQDQGQPKKVLLELEISSQGVPDWQGRSTRIEKRLGLKHLDPPPDLEKSAGEKEGKKAL